ncbi:IMP dehydrogenase family protein [Segniliparus rotundus DSM 44985]|uniref:IMP dehydrogenase family protein n=1 Tax=Segniliparus rotundus (strain ATCC BAA-972 / CDC 1076 / CIP 108378 / DSM 44985 / JCM 13578) TaxID=640132 RepID=D6ZDW3_SEGRD|nr:GuaB3 family IMP dehydrogenase-related protein [Segniliparus rotundus]ADG99370.1 IMP dehydrogenase family protein [Segniliparus rotundus DSM 44985]
MDQLVEIGKGRTARRTYQLEDISIVPSRRTRSSKHVSTSWRLDAYGFEFPLMAHPTDAVVSPETAVRLGALGGLGVLNGEGLWARHQDVEKLFQQVAEVAGGDADSRQAVRLLQELHSAPIRHDLLTLAVKTIKDSGVITAVRVSPQNARELTPVLVSAGIDLLVIQGTIISAEHVTQDAAEPINLKTFIGELDVPVIAGGVSDYRTALHLMRTGAAGVIVGYGSTEGVTTSEDVLGISVPMATAVADAAAARRDYLDETGGRYVHVIADGDITSSGQLAKAIACGADAAMLGVPFAAAAQAPGLGWYWPSAVAHPSVPRGAVAPVDVAEQEDRPTLEQVLFGPSEDPFGTTNLVGGLRRAMAKSGYSDIKEFQKVGLSVRV